MQSLVLSLRIRSSPALTEGREEGCGISHKGQVQEYLGKAVEINFTARLFVYLDRITYKLLSFGCPWSEDPVAGSDESRT